MTDAVQRLRHRLASNESRNAIKKVLREAKKLKAEELIARCRAKLAHVAPSSTKPVPKNLGGPIPQLRQIVTPWVEEPDGILSRCVYSESAES
jgi:hypothetical protein